MKKVEERVVRDLKKEEKEKQKRRRAKDKNRALASSVKRSIKRVGGNETIVSTQATDSSLRAGSQSQFRAMTKWGKASWLEKRNLQWLTGLLDPSIPNCPGPTHGIAPGMNTQIFQVKMVTNMQANAAGFCCCLVDIDKWTKDYTQLSDYVPSQTGLSFVANWAPVTITTAAYATTSLPTVGSTTSTAGVYPIVIGGAGATASTIIPGATVNTAYRMISVGLTVAPDMTALSDSGRLVIGQMPNYNYYQGNSLPAGQALASLEALPASEMMTATFEVPTWPRGKAAQVVAIPTTQVAYQMTTVSSTANSVVSGRGNLWAASAGCTANSNFCCTITFNIEATAVPTYLASSFPDAQKLSDMPINGAYASLPSSAVMQHHGGTPVMSAIGKHDGNSAAKIALHDKALQEPMTKPEAKSWVSDAIGAVETGIDIATTVGSVVEALGALF
jgi:hypothetical protein